MTTMLAPDLLDRRALALLQLVDPTGLPLVVPASLRGPGIKTVAKSGGRWALLEAENLTDYTQAFRTAPGAPANLSVEAVIDIKTQASNFLPRRVTLELPRDPDPANRDQPDSVFQPVTIALPAAPDCAIPATASAVRVTVRKAGDGRRVANALVRVRSDNGQFAAQSLTDPAGEALVIIPDFPPAFTGGGGAMTASLSGKATAVADPAIATLVADADILAARARAAARTGEFPDPDRIATGFPAPAGGTAVQLSVRAIATAEIEWTAP